MSPTHKSLGRRQTISLPNETVMHNPLPLPNLLDNNCERISMSRTKHNNKIYQYQIHGEDYIIRNIICTIRIKNIITQNAKYLLQYTNYSIRNTKYKKQHTKYNIPNTKYRIHNSKKEIQHTKYMNWLHFDTFVSSKSSWLTSSNQTSCIVPPADWLPTILHPARSRKTWKQLSWK